MQLNKVTGLAIAVLILISSLAGLALASIGHGATAGPTTSVGRLVASVRGTTTIHSSTVLTGSGTTRNATTTARGGPNRRQSPILLYAIWTFSVRT